MIKTLAWESVLDGKGNVEIDGVSVSVRFNRYTDILSLEYEEKPKKKHMEAPYYGEAECYGCRKPFKWHGNSAGVIPMCDQCSRWIDG